MLESLSWAASILISSLTRTLIFIKGFNFTERLNLNSWAQYWDQTNLEPYSCWPLAGKMVPYFYFSHIEQGLPGLYFPGFAFWLSSLSFDSISVRLFLQAGRLFELVFLYFYPKVPYNFRSSRRSIFPWSWFLHNQYKTYFMRETGFN